VGVFAAPIRAVTGIFGALTAAPTISTTSARSQGVSSPAANYATYTRAYTSNEIVYSAVKLITTSAGEPHIVGRRMKRAQGEIRGKTKLWKALGVSNRAGSRTIDALLVMNEYVEELPNHPLVKLVNNPNPYTSRGQFWGSIVMDRLLAGNAYALKGRNKVLGNVQELWRLRPDRVRIIPNAEGNAVEKYLYTVGNDSWEFPAADVLHFKEPNPLDPWYGQPVLMAGMARISIDEYFRRYLHTFYQKGGTGPGGMLALKSKVSPEAKVEIGDRFRQMFRNPEGFVETLIVDNTEASYTQFGLTRGLTDALPKEIDAQNEARIAMLFGIPGSILGLLIGYESSSYANKRQDWQVLWDVTMTPLLSDLDDVLNLGLVPEFSGIDELFFDLSDIKALQEDEEALQERARKNVASGLWSWQEGRIATRVEPEPETGIFFLPAGVVARTVDRLGEEPEPPEPAKAAVAALNESFPRRGRPPLSEDATARDLYERGEALRAKHPGMTLDQVAGQMNVHPSTYRRYRSAFRE